MKASISKQALVGLTMFLLMAGSWAQAGEVSVGGDAEIRRAAIEESRRAQTERLDALEKNCEAKFAVTRCVDQVRAERLAIEGKLNRQENVLNDAQRQQRGREQIERNREKAAAHAEKVADQSGTTLSQIKQRKVAPNPAASTNLRQPADPKLPTLTAQERDAHTNDFKRKQADAIAKRAEVAKRLKDSSLKKPSLPKPE